MTRKFALGRAVQVHRRCWRRWLQRRRRQTLLGTTRLTSPYGAAGCRQQTYSFPLLIDRRGAADFARLKKNLLFEPRKLMRCWWSWMAGRRKHCACRFPLQHPPTPPTTPPQHQPTRILSSKLRVEIPALEKLPPPPFPFPVSTSKGTLCRIHPGASRLPYCDDLLLLMRGRCRPLARGAPRGRIGGVCVALPADAATRRRIVELQQIEF